jgi:cell wall-associated NlpC family hydrolase
VTDVSSTVVLPPVAQQVAAAAQTFAGLGPQLASDASSGNFAGMLTAIQDAFAQLDGEAPAAASGGMGVLGAGAMTTASSLGGVGVLGAAPVGQAVTGSQVVADAAQYIGVPYQWGGTSPATGFDCSGLVQHVYADLGIALPRTSQEQATVGSPVASLADARPGDLLFFEPGPGGPGHVGIYIGNGKMIDAPHTGTTVQVQSVWTAPCAIRQIVPSSGPVGAPVSGTPVAAMVGASSPATVAGLGSLGVPATLAPLFLSAGATYGVSPQLLAAVAKVESGYDPTAVSSAGAQGLMQLMPSTASSLGVDPFDPAQAVDGAAQILAGNLKAFGSVPLALAAYNAGAGAVQSYGGIPPYPETQTYVSTIMGLLGGSSS